jgi:protein involved in polysaccharide export with SLBB domain
MNTTAAGPDVRSTESRGGRPTRSRCRLVALAPCHDRRPARWLFGMLLLAAGLSGGCASWSNPTLADSIPVHRLPPEVFGKPREEEKTIPLTLLRQKQPDIYLFEPGDVLGIYVEGVLGEKDKPPPVQVTQAAYPGQTAPNPSVGYPILVQEDGTISLPLLEPLNVKGKSQKQVEEMIKKRYVEESILVRGKERVLVSIFRQRTYHVTVIRQDQGGVVISGAGQFAPSKRGTGVALDLNAYENDVLNALAKSGGLPGLDATNTIVIQRGVENAPAGTTLAEANAKAHQIRVPLRMRPNERLPFSPEDIVLRSGDIIFIESRDTEIYYTGGLLPVAELPLPRDYDLDVMEAVTQCRGPLFNGGVNFNNFVGNITTTGVGAPSPSVVTVIRKTPNCGQITIRVDLNRCAQDPRERILVQPGDFLILQETPGESFTRFVYQKISINFFGTFIRQRDLIATVNTVLP